MHYIDFIGKYIDYVNNYYSQNSHKVYDIEFN